MMYNILETWFCLCVVAVITGRNAAQVDSASTDDVSDDSVVGLQKRGWSMLRLGRGLQMLRLGKRGSSALDSKMPGRQVPMLRLGRASDDASTSLSSSELRALLDSIANTPRDEGRRQPPLPRYGRDSTSARRDLGDASQGALPFSFEILPTNFGYPIFRPAPRGGRYKRSVSSDAYYKMTQNGQESLQKRDASDVQQR